MLGHCWVDTPHIYTFEGNSIFIQVCFLLSTVRVALPAETRIMSTEALLSMTVSVKIHTKADSTIRRIRTAERMRTRQSNIVCRKNAPHARIFMQKKAWRQNVELSKKMCRRPDFWTRSWWVLCPVDIVCNLFSTNHSSKSSSLINQSIN